MKRVVGLTLIIAIITGIAWLVQRGAEERAVRRVLDDIQNAALPGINSHDPKALDAYFATEANHEAELT